jgi:K+-sensing histidine kinase KdpD
VRWLCEPGPCIHPGGADLGQRRHRSSAGCAAPCRSLIFTHRYRGGISCRARATGPSCPFPAPDDVIGTIAVACATAGPSWTVICTTTFANQAAIALEHARLFQQLKEKATQLEAVSRHKSQFLASMSHELRTPLNAIIGFSEVLLDPSLGALTDAEREEFLTNILTSGKHLLRLINDVLDLSKVEAGKMECSANR